MRKLSLAISIALMVPGTSSYAVDEHIVRNAKGVPVFQVRFFDTDSGPFIEGEDSALESAWNMNQQQKSKVLDAISYWANVITPVAGSLPAIINVGTFDDENAAGVSGNVSDASYSQTKLQAVLTGKDPGEPEFGSHAQFILGKLNFSEQPAAPSQLPPPGGTDLTGVAIHELAHGLGISSTASDKMGEDSATPYFDQTSGSWSQHMRDDNGNPARPGQVIICSGCNNAYDPQGFDVRQNSPYFVGINVSEVLRGAMPGIPLKIVSEDGEVDDDYMSHSELKNSLMSHQDYRNYTTFMEAELALLQDMGYQIDRRNYFGFSLYNDGQSIINEHEYFQRNQNGTGYIKGQYNTTPLGLGLHIYGSDNRVFQKGDILTRGTGAAGIRVDGENNTLSVEHGTSIHADGVNGRGVMFSYGKDHNFIQRGDIQAMGENGIAASFDFGNNLLGNDSDYRGSYIHEVGGEKGESLSELDGALVYNVDISGLLAGRSAAIYISPNALVNNINILNGAQLEGDIYSGYAQQDEDGNARLTMLTFGRRADTEGQATEQTDPDFRLRYDGNIEGLESLAVRAEGGITSLNGRHQIYSMNILQQAVVTGDSEFRLNPAGQFVNDGVLSPGNGLGQMTIKGDYRQSEEGQLLLQLDGHGGHDSLTVQGHAELDGNLTFVAVKDWYAPDWSTITDNWVQTDLRSGDFSKISGLTNSPTLELAVAPGPNGSYQLSAHRAANAYSRYGLNGNGRKVGQALDTMVKNAGPDLQSLYRALDFSAASGATVSHALAQLSPAAYSAMFASSLNREHQISDTLNGVSLSSLFEGFANGEWRGFAQPFGGGFWQQRQGNQIGYRASGYGVIVGAERPISDDNHWVAGFHGVISSQSVNVKSPEDGRGKTNAFGLGVQARYQQAANSGGYLFGQARLGTENGRMERRIQVDDYSARNHAEWHGFNGSASAGGGYRWAIGDSLNVGPLAALDYVQLARPDITERGHSATRLKLGSKDIHSLRSRLGVNGEWLLQNNLTASMQLSWDRELRDMGLRQSAKFTGDKNTRFTSSNTIAGRNSLGIQGGASYALSKNAELGVSIASDIFRSGYYSLTGNVSATWRF